MVPILVILGGAEFALHQVISKSITPPKGKEGIDPKSLLLTANDINFKSEDNINLNGWLIHGREGFPALIIAHGYGSNRSETLGKLEGLIASLNKQGYFIFLFDFRGHGGSSSRSALGFREQEDLQAALKQVLQYRHIERRVAVLGIGMGAIAASKASKSADEVKFVILDSIYEDISFRCTEQIKTEWPFLSFAGPFLSRAVDWNLRQILGIPDTELGLAGRMPALYPKTVLYVEKKPLRDDVKALYEATKEPKELIQLDETASGELIGDLRLKYTREIETKILEYLPAIGSGQTLELSN